MISASDTQDFVPFGREYIRRHPGPFQIQIQNACRGDAAVPLIRSFREISLQDAGKKEQWLFFGTNEYEVSSENGQRKPLQDGELYVSGSTVVLSQTGQDGVHSVVKTLTMETPVIQALWATFILDNDEPSQSLRNISSNTSGKVQKGICVVESSVMTFFMDEGGEYSTVLPFQVSRVWPIKNGLIFERTLTPSEISFPKKNSPNQTILFSLFHPLDDVSPIISKTTAGKGPPKINYLTDNSQHILFTSQKPSLAFTYDTMLGLHSAWRIRPSRPEEVCSALSNLDNSIMQLTPMLGMNQSSESHSRLFANISGPSSNVSPLRNLPERRFSPANIMRSSPGLTHFTSSRSHSPALASSEAALYRFHSPSPQIRSANMYLRTPCSSHNISAMSNKSYLESSTPSQPEICLEHLWTEPIPPIRDGPLGKASKVFLSEDFCGQQYLCFMVPYRQSLKCVKFEESNDLSQLIFGSMTVLPAKDACCVESRQLLLILETTGFITVYTGTTKISHLHIPLLPFASGSLSIFRPETPPGNPSSGEIFTSSRPPSAMDARFDEEMTHISPVPLQLEGTPSHLEGSVGDGIQGTSLIHCLRDSLEDKIIVEMLNGALYRTTIPPICTSPGINLCLKALKHLLPREVALQLLGHWYIIRNSPGGLGSQSEWHVFQRCLLDLMGYNTSRLSLTGKHDLDRSMSPIMSAKRARPSEQGSEDDWDYISGSAHHSFAFQGMEDCLGLGENETIRNDSAYSKPCAINTAALLFPYSPSVLLSLHLVYEELKLNILLHEDVKALAPLLNHISRDLRCHSYSDLYCRDFPHLFDMHSDTSQVSEEHLSKMQYPQLFPLQVPSVQEWIYQNFHGNRQVPYVYIPFVCTSTVNVISLYALLLHQDVGTEQAIERCLHKLAPAGHRAPTADLSLSCSFNVSPTVGSIIHRMVLTMTHLGLTQEDIDCLPVGISLPLREAIFQCRCNPPSDWFEKEYNLIGRQDLWQLLLDPAIRPKHGKTVIHNKISTLTNPSKDDDEDGMEHLDNELLFLRWKHDLRVQEVCRMLQSARPVKIAVVQRPEVSDHDFIEEQERHLYSICIRTMALPVGRGMFSMCTYTPLTTEALPIPKLCLTGRAPPRNTTVDLTRVEVPANMSVWPLFHNGVAAGLRIADSSQVESAWIIYNKPKNNDLTNEYAGFLMALGLNGHLPKLNTLSVHDYLSKGHEMTTIGILLGLAAAKRGTMDLATTKILSVHVPALLPPTSTELNIPHNVQVAAVLGVGLVYQGTAHSHMAEVLLAEIGRPPGPEMENCIDRESYSLAAGLALGMVMFGKGKQAVGLSSQSMADILCHLMVGGQRRPLPGLYRERFRSPSYLIKEGDCVNVDVTSPGATLALGMLFFKTGNSAVAEWLKAPDTQFMLDQVRPDFLLLRTLSRGLVMWNTVIPSMAWVESNIPEIVKKYSFKRGQEEAEDIDDSVDFETMSQAWINILAGGCMVLGLKFAGTANKAAFNSLMECMRQMLIIISTPSMCEQAGKNTTENCMSVVLIALAMVMSGTGDLQVLRLCRFLRKRVGLHYGVMLYGSHLAHSMATGLLFLGGGKYTLSTTPEAVGAMLVAFFPKFPISSTDNKYHLQAFRHLYALAAQPRILIPRDVDSGQACYVPVQINFRDCADYYNESFTTHAPCLLPELDAIEEVKVLGPRYWPITFHRAKNWDKIKMILQNGGVLSVKQRAGHLSYLDDPKGYRSMLAKSLSTDHSCHCSIKPDVIKSFTSDARITALADFFLDNSDQRGMEIIQQLSAVVYHCVVQEKSDAIYPHFVLEQLLHQSSRCNQTWGIWQLKLCLAYYKSPYRKAINYGGLSLSALMENQFLLFLSKKIDDKLDQWQTDNKDILQLYLTGHSMKNQEVRRLSQYLTWFDIPASTCIAQLPAPGSYNYIS